MRLCLCLIIIIISSVQLDAAVTKNCTGKFINPISDVCWDCLFPLSIGSIKLIGDRPDPKNPSSPICACPTPFPRVGLSIGLWEPARLVDVTHRPFCFPNLDGLQINIGDPIMGYGTRYKKDGRVGGAFWQVHWYQYPLLYWLEILMDFICLEQSSFDLLYISEFDPMWNDDELSFLINPEAALFGNPVVQAACAADCVKSSASLPIDSLFWCAGCHGGLYPFTGRVQEHASTIQSSLLAAERMIAKLHRQFVAWGTSGDKALCSKYPMPVIKKSQYRSQLVVPVPVTSGRNACPPLGRSTVFYESGKEIPVAGEDFGYLIWRKRNCCAF